METYNRYIGKVFDGRYRIEKVVGLGGMAVVFKATDLSYGRTVAVKMLREDMATDPTNVKRFENESKAVVLLEHENIVKIYDVNVSGALKYFVMEYIEGITLKEYMKSKDKLDTSEVISCAEQILRALEHAHAKGVIHRDIKPQNVILKPSGQIKVTDFGIAKLPSAETVTMEDKAIGTVFYISPEQASGKRVDSRTDIYSLGALLYEMATGQLPYDGENSVSIALKHIKEDPIPPREIDKSIPEGLEQLITKAMKRPPLERFQTASEMLSCVLKLKKNPGAALRLKNKNPKTKEHGGTSMFPIILGAMCAFIIALIITIMFLLNTFFAPSSSDDEFKVGNYVDLFYSDELKEELDHYFDEVKIEYSYSEKYGSGFILEQSVAPNLVRIIGASDITLTISIGREQTVMPDLTFYSLNEAIVAISNLNFDLRITQARRADDAIEEGYLITTDPAPGAIINKGDTITLIVSDGEKIEYVTVPNLVYDSQKKNRTEEEAYKLLSDANLKIGTVKHIQSIEYEKGTVLEQSIPSGQKVAGGVTAIDLVISGGLDGEVAPDAESMYMIDVSAISLEAAVAKLQSYNLEFDIKTEYISNNIYPAGVVCSTYPEAKLKVERGASITLYVSAGAANIVTVPNVLGMTESEARAAIIAAGLRVGTVTAQYNSTTPEGLIHYQSVEAFSQVAEGTVVNLRVSKGPEPQ